MLLGLRLTTHRLHFALEARSDLTFGIQPAQFRIQFRFAAAVAVVFVNA